MNITSLEIESQPELWRRSLELLDDATRMLTRPGERVLVIGCGTSAFVAESFALLREQAGFGETDAAYASEPRPWRDYDAVIGITRSGTTTEVVQALRALPAGVRRIVVTGVADSPCAELADEVLLLDFADERSVVQTRFATSTLALLRADLGEDLTGAIADARTAVAADLPEGALERTQFTFLGRHWTVGLANEAALKMREASLSWSESYPAMEYRHGPISIADARSLVWMLGSAPEGLAAEVAATGATWVELSLDPMAELIRAQRVAIAVGHARGLDPDNPRHLTRSVILT